MIAVLAGILTENFSKLKHGLIESIRVDNFEKKNLGQDLLASLVTYLVALPLCLGIAIASGVPPVYGLISGVIGGLVTGIFSGCSLQISGPAGGLIVIVIEIVQNFGLEKLGIIVFFAGVLQIITGLAGLAAWFQIVSPSIIRGMLAGIGIVICASQFHVMLNSTPQASTLKNIFAIPEVLIRTIAPRDDSTYHLAAGIGLITFLAIVAWRLLPYKFSKSIPPTLIAVLFASLVASTLDLPIEYVNIPSNFTSGITPMHMHLIPEVLTDFNSLFAITALTFITSIEAMLTSKAIEKFNPECKTKADQEIISQGLGNGLAGLLNVLPITGVIVRSVTAFDSGGKTKLVAVFQGLWILITLLFLRDLIAYIPLASLAAILVLISFSLINLSDFKRIYVTNRTEFLICIITTTLVAVTNIFEGVLIGVIIASVKALKDLSKFQAKFDHISGNKIELKLVGSLNFINSHKLEKLLRGIPQENEIWVDVEKLHYIDHSCFDILSDWENRYSSTGGTVILELGHIAEKFDLHKAD